MRSAISQIEHDRRERLARIAFAFQAEAVATTATLRAVLTTIYRHAPEPLAHATRVADIAVRVGGELGLADRALEQLERAAWIHDIGKLVVPDDPNEADTDDGDDLALWVDQVEAAVEIGRSVPFLVPAAEIVLGSRECFDGSGYPRGLKGEQIPLGARVLYVADMVDAMTTLCYALAVSADGVGMELVRNAGSRFDPDVVAACLRCSDCVPLRLPMPAQARARV